MAVDPQRGLCLNSRGSAYCCDIDPEPLNLPTPGIDPNGQPALLARAWANWLRTRFCDFTVGPSVSKRSGSPLLSDVLGSTPAKRAIDFENPSQRDIAEFVRYLLSRSPPSSAVVALRETWDRLMQSAGSAFNFLTIANLISLVSMFEGVSPVDVVSMLLCAGEQPSVQLRNTLGVRSQLCTNTCFGRDSGDLRRDELHGLTSSPSGEPAPHDKRAFNWLPDPVRGLPGWGPAVDAIVNNQLRMEYFTLFRYANGGQGRQIELEVVYLLAGQNFVPNTPGHALISHLQSNTATDRFMVLHIHLAEGFGVNGQNVPNIQSINIRHASSIYQTTNQVNPTPGRVCFYPL